jgi:hypothetical protein
MNMAVIVGSLSLAAEKHATLKNLRAIFVPIRAKIEKLLQVTMNQRITATIPNWERWQRGAAV